jgi:hypothetical protein
MTTFFRKTKTKNKQLTVSSNSHPPSTEPSYPKSQRRNDVGEHVALLTCTIYKHPAKIEQRSKQSLTKQTNSNKSDNNFFIYSFNDLAYILSVSQTPKDRRHHSYPNARASHHNSFSLTDQQRSM